MYVCMRQNLQRTVDLLTWKAERMRMVMTTKKGHHFSEKKTG